MNLGSALAVVFVLIGSTTTVLAVTEPKIVSTIVTGRTVMVSDTPAAPGELSGRTLLEQIEAKGYGNITEFEYEHGRYELEATDPEGRRVELEIDARTGLIVKTEVK